MDQAKHTGRTDERMIDGSREQTNHGKHSRDESSETKYPHTHERIKNISRERTNHGETSRKSVKQDKRTAHDKPYNHDAENNKQI